jgi:hypothetical protein
LYLFFQKANIPGFGMKKVALDSDNKVPAWLLPGLFFASRVMIFLTLVNGGSDAFGDLFEYFGIGQLQGWPFFGYWVEYPPAFAFLNELIYRLVNGQALVFYFVYTLLLGLSGAACLYFFQRIAGRIFGQDGGLVRALVFFGLIIWLPYTWWTYDLLPLALLFAGIDCFLGGAPLLSGISIGFGLLTKWFPGLIFPALLRYRPGKSAIKVVAISMLMFLAFVLPLWIASPLMTRASLASQPLRTSWQTIWAYLDGNRVTGHFVYFDWRYDPAQAYVPRGNPARIPALAKLAVFGAAGLFFFWRVKNLNDRSMISFMGITIAMFFIWSQGWSPQWIIFMLAPVLLTLPLPQAVIINLTLLLICLFEWPFALGQSWYRATFAMDGLRTLAFGVLVILWYRITRQMD